MKNFLLVCVFLLLIGCQKNTPKQHLNSIIETYQNHKENENQDFPLGDYRELSFEKYATFCDSLLTELNTMDSTLFNEDDLISYTLLKFVLNETLEKFKFKSHWNPILSDAGFHSSLTYQVRPITSKKGALNYLKKLKAIPDYIDQQTQLIRKGLKVGMGQPLVIFKGYESTYDQHITSTAEENFY